MMIDGVTDLKVGAFIYTLGGGELVAQKHDVYLNSIDLRNLH